jgi:putative DNA primase/helicase
MTTPLSQIARALGGDVVGRNSILAPGPGHSPRDRSLSILIDPAAPDGFVVHSQAGDPDLLCKDYVRKSLGHSDWAPSSKNGTPVTRSAIAPVPLQSDEDRERETRARAIWAEARDPYGTPVEVYLTRSKSEGGREVDLPPESAGDAIRYHPSCPFAGSRTPAMVCLVRDIYTNEPRAIHRTALSLDGFKANVGGHERLSLGPIGGGAIKLTPDEDVTTCLGVGEGIESTLSLRLAPEFGLSPVWCLLSAGGVANLPVLPGVECLWIAVDHDPAGLKAAASCSDRWRAAGREVFLVRPTTERSDLNDIVKGGRRHA